MKFQNISDSEFAERIINSLPGIFYLYEKVGDQLLLKRWNKNHETDLGYSSEDLLNKRGSSFFTNKEFKRVAKEIEQVFIKGTSQVTTRLITKSGKQIPYLLEAFSFIDDDRYYFMGVGIDITNQLMTERDLVKANIEQIKLKQEKIFVTDELEIKKRELIITAVESAKTNKIIKSTISQINKLINDHSQNELHQELVAIRRNLKMQIKTQDNWEVFKIKFAEVHKDFFDKLSKKYPGLTKNELKFCAYLSIDLSPALIGLILNVSPHAIKKTRYRIRKKMGLKTRDSLEKSIRNL